MSQEHDNGLPWRNMKALNIAIMYGPLDVSFAKKCLLFLSFN